MKIQYRINGSKIVLVLSGENELVDFYALKYLDRAIERKQAREALILTYTEQSFQMLKDYRAYTYPITIKRIKKTKIDRIYRWYRMVKFSPNIFFTFTDKTKDNLLGKFIRETDINEKDVVCLAIYNFRMVPEET